jgi:hypothetical protein
MTMRAGAGRVAAGFGAAGGAKAGADSLESLPVTTLRRAEAVAP